MGFSQDTVNDMHNLLGKYDESTPDMDKLADAAFMSALDGYFPEFTSHQKAEVAAFFDQYLDYMSVFLPLAESAGIPVSTYLRNLRGSATRCIMLFLTEHKPEIDENEDSDTE